MCSSCEDITEKSSCECLDPTDKACIRRNYIFPNDTQENEWYNITANNGTGNGNHLVKSKSRVIDKVEESEGWNSWGILTRFILGRFRDYLLPTGPDEYGFETLSSTPELMWCDLSWCAKLYHNFTYQNVSRVRVTLWSTMIH